MKQAHGGQVRVTPTAEILFPLEKNHKGCFGGFWRGVQDGRKDPHGSAFPTFSDPGYPGTYGTSGLSCSLGGCEQCRPGLSKHAPQRPSPNPSFDSSPFPPSASCEPHQSSQKLEHMNSIFSLLRRASKGKECNEQVTSFPLPALIPECASLRHLSHQVSSTVSNTEMVDFFCVVVVGLRVWSSWGLRRGRSAEAKAKGGTRYMGWATGGGRGPYMEVGVEAGRGPSPVWNMDVEGWGWALTSQPAQEKLFCFPFPTFVESLQWFSLVGNPVNLWNILSSSQSHL